MTEVRKEGKIPCNVRVDVDYTGKKPKIKFGYLSKNPKKDAIGQTTNTYLFVLIWLLLASPSFYFIYLSSVPHPYPIECGNLTFDDYKSLTETTVTGNFNYSYNTTYQKVYGFNLTCDGVVQVFEFQTATDYYINPYFTSISYDYWELVGTALLGLWFFISIFVSIIINKKFINPRLIKSERYRKWLPVAQAEGYLIKRKRFDYYKYKPSDVLENVVVIPRFDNVILKYTTTGDFNKYLEKIKIREYKKQRINIRNNKKSKIKSDAFKWYAVFYFKQKPKSGYLEVIYK